ncbi:MAG: HD-GYP domain-containing protein [Alcanivoracaceae bacterium]|nr:HD-GYP domain-containing protein [Alcanivoracaceae bacterium]
MSVKVQHISTQDLQMGMYVSQLDRPWIETPFPLQGFHIRSEDDIAKLRVFCKYVYIDTKLGVAPLGSENFRHAAPVRKADKPAAPKGPVRGNLGKFEPVRYQVRQPLKKEVITAAPLHRDLTRAVLHLMKNIREGNGVNLKLARKAGHVVVESVLRNPDAMIWLSRLKEKDSYSYNHSVRCSILAAVFGRHLGLPKDALENLATGALLMDIGNVMLPRELLARADAELSSSELEILRSHVEKGVKLLEESGQYDEQSVGVVHHHHERHDGSGYPYGLTGTQIPLLARIAGIVDTYDAITSPRPWADAITPTEAVSLLYEQREKKFQGKLVEQFIQAVGVYPTGTLVELSNGEVGAVIAQNTARRLRPQVMVVLDAGKAPLPRPHVVDLMSTDSDEAGRPLAVTSSLMAGSYDIDLSRLQINAA